VLDLGAILTAMVTPFDADGAVDEGSAIRLMHHLADHGSDGIVLAGTTGEAATLSDEEHARLIRLGVHEMGDRLSIVAGCGSNDTRHAVHLTEQATEAGADAILSVTPYYVKPNRRGVIRHFEEVAKATDKPIVLYNIPSRTALDMPNDLLAELAQIDGVEAVKQARTEDLEPIDGLQLYAGNDDTLARVLDLGAPGGILVASHVVGEEMRRMVDEPARRHEIDDALKDVYRAMTVTANPIPVKTAVHMLGLIDHGTFRLPYVEADESEREAVRTTLERHGLLARA
jgi:4-hydroxy-tetrahydrodipicolinate synthase